MKFIRRSSEVCHEIGDESNSRNKFPHYYYHNLHQNVFEIEFMFVGSLHRRGT